MSCVIKLLRYYKFMERVFITAFRNVVSIMILSYYKVTTVTTLSGNNL